MSDPGAPARVATAVLALRGVSKLDGGPFGTVASHLPGRRRILGVRLGMGAEPTEIAVVARLGVPLPRLADEVAAAVRTVLGPVPVEVTFSDVVPGPAVVPEPPAAARRAPGRPAQRSSAEARRSSAEGTPPGGTSTGTV